MQRKSALLYIVFSASYLLGLMLIGIAAWGDYESTSYGFPRRANTQLGGLYCPILMTRNETATIALRVTNSTDQLRHPSIRTEFSAQFDRPSSIDSVDLAPGETKQLEWTVGPENVDLGNFILASVQVYAFYPIPTSQSTCGIFIVDLPGRGMTIYIALSVVSLIGLGWGLYSIRRSGFSNGRMANIRSALFLLTGLIVAGFILSFLGAWLPSAVVLVVAVLISFLILNPS